MFHKKLEESEKDIKQKIDDWFRITAPEKIHPEEEQHESYDLYLFPK